MADERLRRLERDAVQGGMRQRVRLLYEKHRLGLPHETCSRCWAERAARQTAFVDAALRIQAGSQRGLVGVATAFGAMAQSLVGAIVVAVRNARDFEERLKTVGQLTERVDP